MRKILYFFALSLFVVACQNDKIDELDLSSTAEYDADVVLKWTNLYLEIEENLPAFRPTPTSRALGYISLAAYEVGVPGMTKYKTSSEVLNHFPSWPKLDPRSSVNYELALNQAYRELYFELLHNMNFAQKSSVTNLFDKLRSEYSSGITPEVIKASENWGAEVAKAVIAYADSDLEGYKQVRDVRPSNYIAPKGAGLWEPTAPDFGKAVSPFFSKVRLLAVGQDDIKVLPPPAYSTDPNSQYYKDFKEVNDRVTNIANNSKDEWIAEFWSDDLTGVTFSPPARNFAIANQLVEKERLNLENTLLLYLQLGLATNDAAVGAWSGKFTYNVERPANFIQKHINKDFIPILGKAINNIGISPSFPGYPSGHSTFGGIAGIVLEETFGKRYTFTDNCHKGRTDFMGFPRTYLTFQEMGEENAYSRIPLGVHPKFDCDEGLRLGRVIGSKVMALDFEKF